MWVYGIVEPGWYKAKCDWDEGLAQHWRSLGYRVESYDPRQPNIDA